MKNSLTLLFFSFKQDKLVSVLTYSMHMHCRPIENNNAQFTYATKIISFAIKKMIIFEYLKNRKLKINKIFVCLGHTNLSFSSLDSLAPLFPECNFFLNCRLSLQKCWKTHRYPRTDPCLVPLKPHYYKKN